LATPFITTVARELASHLRLKLTIIVHAIEQMIGGEGTGFSSEIETPTLPLRTHWLFQWRGNWLLI